MTNKLKNLLLIFLTFLLSACGGGGGGSPAPAPPPTKVVVKLATTGTLTSPLTIGGISTAINYPTDKVSIIGSDVIASGSASGATLFANVATPGSVTLGNVTLNGAGFLDGEFATLTFTISGVSPQASDFTVAPGSIIGSSDLFPIDLTSSLTVIIKSVTLQ